MAAIDKIYGTREQHQEFMAWVLTHKPELREYFYPEPEGDAVGPLTNFPVWADEYLWNQCMIPWVQSRLHYQYSGRAPGASTEREA